jgi:hypothetical protein
MKCLRSKKTHKRPDYTTGRSPVSHPTCEVPFPPRRSGEYRKGMIPARPWYQGGWGSVWDPEPSKERVGDGGGPATVWSLLCVAERVPQGRTESGGIVLAANAGPRVPSGGVTLKRRCTYRPSAIYLIVNKLLSLSLSLSLPLSLSPRQELPTNGASTAWPRSSFAQGSGSER